MDDIKMHFEAELRRRISRLLDDGAKWKKSRAEMLDKLLGLREPTYLFGGTVRDIMLRSPYHPFRDIDVVVHGVTAKRLRAEFGECLTRETRFGGLHLDVDGWLFDVWPLEDTWAFRRYPLLLSPEPESLARTTFMTIEAVVVHLNGARGRRREIYEHGFYEAMATKTIELNFEHTPYVALNIVRSLLTARRLRFAIGPRLVDFICQSMRHIKIGDLVSVQRHHYGVVWLKEGVLSNLLGELSEWQKWHPSRAMPIGSLSQMSFDWSTARVSPI